jgi:hypothetical protein
MITPKENMASNLVVKRCKKASTAADDTYVDGAILDRLADYARCPQSLLAIVTAWFTWDTGSGASDTNTLTIKVEHGDASNLSDAATLDSDTYTYTWAADGAADGVHMLPVDLSSAKRYIRVSAKLTAAHSPTIADQYIASCVVLGGMDQVASSNFVAAGYEETTEPA